jgi:hypothetical protein
VRWLTLLSTDCTGHSKAGVKWLEHLNRGPIPQVSYDPLARYVTCRLNSSHVAGNTTDIEFISVVQSR